MGLAMLSTRPGQLRLNQADLYYLDMVGRESFYGVIQEFGGKCTASRPA